MNIKLKDFLISLSITFVFTTILTLFVNYALVLYFGLNETSFLLITLFLSIFGLVLFLILSKSIIKPLFKSDEKLRKTAKETLHELNIPVSTILLNTQMLQRSTTDEKFLKRLGRIQKASKDLLDLYKNMEYDIKKEINSVDKNRISLDEVLENCIDKFKDIKKDIKIDKNVNTNILIEVDKNGFYKIINNLLSNAIKYNKKNGYIKIGFKKEKILFIENSGNTIDTKHLTDVFDKYFQEEYSKDGFGLGLSIVKDFCDKNFIFINIIPLSKGTRFELNLKNILVKKS